MTAHANCLTLDPLTADPATPVEGCIWYRSDLDELRGKLNSAIRRISPPSREKHLTVENPSASEDISWFFVNRAVTITEIRAVLVGSSPSVTWTIRHGTDRSAAGAEVTTGGRITTSTTVGDDVTSFDDATIAADSHVWIETTASSSCDQLVLTAFYDED